MNLPCHRFYALAFISALSGSACDRHDRSAAEDRTDVVAGTTIMPWKPVDGSFTGCENG